MADKGFEFSAFEIAYIRYGIQKLIESTERAIEKETNGEVRRIREKDLVAMRSILGKVSA